jgi:hypothetical protein
VQIWFAQLLAGNYRVFCDDERESNKGSLLSLRGPNCFSAQNGFPSKAIKGFLFHWEELISKRKMAKITQAIGLLGLSFRDTSMASFSVFLHTCMHSSVHQSISTLGWSGEPTDLCKIIPLSSCMQLIWSRSMFFPSCLMLLAFD